MKNSITILSLILCLISCSSKDNKTPYKQENDIIINGNNLKNKEARKLFQEGINSVKKQNFKIAKQKFIAVNKIEKNNARVINNIAMAEFRLGEKDEALKTFNKALNVDSTYLDTYSNLGSSYIRMGDYLKAKTILLHGNKFFTKNQSNSSKADFLFNLSYAYFNLNNCKDALMYSTKALGYAQNQDFSNQIKELKKASENCLKRNK